MSAYYSLYPTTVNGGSVWTAEWRRGFPADLSVTAQGDSFSSAYSAASIKKRFANITNPQNDSQNTKQDTSNPFTSMNSDTQQEILKTQESVSLTALENSNYKIPVSAPQVTSLYA